MNPPNDSGLPPLVKIILGFFALIGAAGFCCYGLFFAMAVGSIFLVDPTVDYVPECEELACRRECLSCCKRHGYFGSEEPAWDDDGLCGCSGRMRD